jgi:hypothetical protein
MPARPLENLMRNDLKVVSVFMVFIFVLTAGMEIRPQEKVVPVAPSVPPTQGNNQTQDLTTEEVLSKSGYTNEGQSSEETFKLDYKQVSMVKTELKWTDDYGSNDNFLLEVSLNGDSLGSDQGTSGTLTVQLKAGPDENLAGNFTVTVTCSSAPGVIGPSPIDRDKGNSWDLTATATHSQEGSP